MDILSHFNKLSLHTINLLEQKRYIEFQENIDTFFYLFEYSLKNSSNPDNSRLIASLSDNIIDLGKDELNKGFIDETMSLITKLLNATQNNINSNTLKTIDRLSNGIVNLGKQALSKGFIDESLDIVKELLTYLQRNSSSNILKITNKVSDNIIDFGKIALEKGFLNAAMDLTEYIVDVSSSLKKDKGIDYSPYLFDLITGIVKSVRNQDNITLIHTIRQFLYKISNREEKFIRQDLMRYYSSYYFSLSQNKTIDIDDKESLIVSLIRNVISDLIYPKENNIQLYKDIIYFLVKHFVETSKYEYFTYLLNDLYNGSKYNMKEYIYEIFVTVSAYLYYISFKEVYYNNIFKDEVKQLLSSEFKEKLSTKKTFNLRNFVTNSDGDFWNFYSVVKNELRNKGWEYIPSNDAKLMHMERDLREFYIFYSFLTTSSFHFNSVALQKLDLNELRVLSEFFDSNHQLKISYHENLLTFIKWFCPDGDNEVDINSILNNQFIGEQIINAYKQKVFENLISYNKEHKVIQKNEELLKSKVISLIKNSAFNMFTDLPTNKYSDNIKNIKISSSISIPIEYLAEKVHFFNFEPDKMILEQIETEILQFLSPKLEVLEFKFNDSNKIEKLFSLINSLKEQKVIINSIIKDVNEESIVLSYYEAEQNKEALERFEENIYSLGHLAYHKNTLYLDKKMINIKVLNYKLSFRNIKNDDIEVDLKETKIDDDTYRVNTTNDIHIELTHDEATKYFKNSYKILEAKLEVEIYTSDKIGILISYKS